ncbi:hypothetical protein LguiB_002377 [Lonicera macranthoides]
MNKKELKENLRVHEFNPDLSSTTRMSKKKNDGDYGEKILMIEDEREGSKKRSEDALLNPNARGDDGETEDKTSNHNVEEEEYGDCDGDKGFTILPRPKSIIIAVTDPVRVLNPECPEKLSRSALV